MTRTLPATLPTKFSTIKWLQILFLGAALAIGVQQARAQMSGEFAGDLAIVSSALATTIAATGKDDAQASRVAMEELYRQWRILRAKNFEAQASNPLFLPEMEKVGDRLFAASKLVDQGAWAQARNELQMAEKLLQSLRLKQPDIVKPIASNFGHSPAISINYLFL